MKTCLTSHVFLICTLVVSFCQSSYAQTPAKPSGLSSCSVAEIHGEDNDLYFLKVEALDDGKYRFNYCFDGPGGKCTAIGKDSGYVMNDVIQDANQSRKGKELGALKDIALYVGAMVAANTPQGVAAVVVVGSTQTANSINEAAFHGRVPNLAPVTVETQCGKQPVQKRVVALDDYVDSLRTVLSDFDSKNKVVKGEPMEPYQPFWSVDQARSAMNKVKAVADRVFVGLGDPELLKVINSPMR